MLLAKHIFTHCLAFCIGIILPYNAVSQPANLRFEKVNIEDNPMFGSVDCFYEDSRGFMWFGTYGGLYLYDGYKLSRYENSPDDPLSISDNKIKKISEDSPGNFWVGTQNGLNYFEVKKRIFKRYTDPVKNGMGSYEVNDIKKDVNNDVWIANVDGLYSFDSVTLKFIKKFPEKPSKGAIVNAIEFVKNGILIATTKGLYFQRKANTPFQFVPTVNSGGKDSLNITALQQDKFGNVWIGTTTGLYHLLEAKDQLNYDFVHPALTQENIFFINPKNDHELWVGTTNGLLIFNTQNLQYERYVNDPNNPQSLSKNNVERGYQSSNHTFWLSTISDQLHKVDLQKSRFQNVRLRVRDVVSTARLAYELYEYAPDTLLIPQKIGPSFLNLKTKKLTPFAYKPTFNQEGWKTGMICFLEESDGKLWIGTNGGLFLFDKTQKRFIDVEKQIKEIASFRGNAIRKIRRDRQGNLWVGTWHHGICKINFRDKTFKRYNNTPELLANLISNTRQIMEDRRGNMWIGTRGGLLKYMEKGDTFKIYRNVPNDNTSMSENTAFTIYEDEQGNIWCGTYGGGLNKLDVNTEKFKHYTTKDGLADNTVFAIMPDKIGKLWLCSYKGLSVFDPQTETFILFNNTSGLLNEGYDAFIHGKGRFSDRFFFGGNEGIDFFNPNNIQLSTHDPRVYITDFKLFNKTVPISKGQNTAKGFSLSEDISFTKHLTLTYDQNVITYEYVALDYSAPKNIQYAYKLEGFDTAWQNVGNQRSATFTNLNPGNYTFRVKATNGDGVWGSKEAVLHMTVLSPWWRTWWFIGLVVVSLFALGFAFYSYRVRQIKEKEAIKTSLNKRIAEVKMEALRSQMNPHFIFNALTSINLFILKNDTETASYYLNKFSKLMRDVLDHSRSELISVEEEITTLKLYVEIEKMRFKDNFNFILDIQPTANVADVKIPPLIIQPYVENAIWHGLKHKKEGEGVLKIAVFEEADYLHIVVEDNGIGRTKVMEQKKASANQHKSHGLNVTEERLRFFNETMAAQASIETIDLKDNQHNAIGTQINVKIKI